MYLGLCSLFKGFDAAFTASRAKIEKEVARLLIKVEINAS